MGAAAMALSLMLIPSGREMALLRIEAGESYLAASILQARVAAGDRSPATMAALARALTALGDVAGAARLLEGFVAERPRDPAALEALAGFQRSAGRADGLIRTLQALQEVAPAAERLREIARLHAGAGREAEQREALRALVERFPAEAADYLTLARLEHARGQHLAGAALLQELAERHPPAMDASIVALEAGMLLAGGEPERALARARHWLGGRDDLGQTAPVLAGALGVGGRPDLAVALLEPHAGPGAAPRLIAALAQAESDAGNPVAALHRLERLDATPEARGGVEVALLRLRLALAVGDTDRAVAAAERAGWPAAAQGELLRRLSAIALAAGRTDAIRRVLDAAGEAYVASDPVLAARLHLALGNTEAARRWSERAMDIIVGRPEEDVLLADVEVRLGRMDRALELLRRAVSEPGLPPTMPRQIASIFVRTGRPDEGALVLDELRRRQPSDAAESAWALAAAAAGQTREVAAWLSARGKDELSPDVLQDMVHLAADAGARGLAAAAAERLVAVRGSPADGLLLARLLLDAGQARRALERVRALPPGTEVPEDFRTAVLFAAWRQGAPVADAVRALWLRRLRAATDPAARNEAILALLELRAHAEVLPALRGLAEQDPERWLWAFGNAATAAGRRADLLALWAELSRRPGLSGDLRRQLGFQLLEAGDKRGAELAFRTLAAAAPPTSRDVRQLLFLWGPRPASEQLDWLEARARAASGQDRVAWMRLLTDRGAPTRAIAIYRATARDGAPAGARSTPTWTPLRCWTTRWRS